MQLALHRTVHYGWLIAARPLRCGSTIAGLLPNGMNLQPGRRGVGFAPVSPPWRLVSWLGFTYQAAGRGDQRLYRVPEGLGTAGGAAEDQCALEDRHDEIGQGHGALGVNAPGSEVADERSPPPGEHFVELGAELFVLGCQFEHHRGNGAAAAIARRFEALHLELGERLDQRGGIMRPAGRLVDHVLDLVCRSGGQPGA